MRRSTRAKPVEDPIYSRRAFLNEFFNRIQTPKTNLNSKTMKRKCAGKSFESATSKRAKTIGGNPPEKSAGKSIGDAAKRAQRAKTTDEKPSKKSAGKSIGGAAKRAQRAKTIHEKPPETPPEQTITFDCYNNSITKLNDKEIRTPPLDIEGNFGKISENVDGLVI